MTAQIDAWVVALPSLLLPLPPHCSLIRSPALWFMRHVRWRSAYGRVQLIELLIYGLQVLLSLLPLPLSSCLFLLPQGEVIRVAIAPRLHIHLSSRPSAGACARRQLSSGIEANRVSFLLSL